MLGLGQGAAGCVSRISSETGGQEGQSEEETD